MPIQIFHKAGVVAVSYADGKNVSADAHPGCAVLYADAEALVTSADDEGLPVYTLSTDLAVRRRAAASTVDHIAATIRASVVGNDPAKVVTYLVKQLMAAGTIPMSAEATAAATREAMARGLTLAQLKVSWTANAGAWLPAALLIDAVAAEAKRAIAAATDIPAIDAALASAAWADVYAALGFSA